MEMNSYDRNWGCDISVYVQEFTVDSHEHLLDHRRL